MNQRERKEGERSYTHDLTVDWAPYDAPGYTHQDPPTKALPVAFQEACGCAEIFYANPPKETDADHNRTYPLYCVEHLDHLGFCSRHRIPHPGCSMCDSTLPRQGET